MALKQNRLLYFRLFLLNTGSMNISVQLKGSTGKGVTAILPLRQQKLLSSPYSNSALQWGQTLTAPRAIGVGFGVRCTGSASQRLLETICMVRVRARLASARTTLLRSVACVLKLARTSDDCRARASLMLLLAVFSLCSVVRASDVLRALLLAVYSRHSACT